MNEPDFERDELAAREGRNRRHADDRTTTAWRDPDAATWSIGHEIAGPGGTATSMFDRGTSLTVDVADPRRILTLTVPASLERWHADLVEVLFGTAAAHALSAARGDVLGCVPVDPVPSRARTALCRLALLDGLREHEEEEADLVWPLWAADAAALGASAPWAPTVWARARAEARVAVDALTQIEGRRLNSRARRTLGDVVAAILEVADVEVRPFLEALLRQSEPDAKAEPDRVRTALRAVLERTRFFAEIRWLEPRGAALGGRGDREPDLDFRVDPALQAHGIDIRRRAVGYLEHDLHRLEVELATASPFERDVLWARVYLVTDDLEPLDRAPLVGVAPGLARAGLTVPDGVSADRLHVDVTATPTQPPVGSRRRARADAITAGFAAAAAERLEWMDTAHDGWRASAQLWKEARLRPQQAMALGCLADVLDRMDGRSGTEMREEARAVATESAWRVQPRDELPAAYLAELIRPLDAR